MFSKKEFALVSNLRFISLSADRVEHGNSLITSGPGLVQILEQATYGGKVSS